MAATIPEFTLNSIFGEVGGWYAGDDSDRCNVEQNIHSITFSKPFSALCMERVGMTIRYKNVSFAKRDNLRF